MPRDERTYITVHDGMPDHPKVEGLSDSAFRLMVELWCWCSRNQTDGRIVATSWAKRGSRRAREELIAAGLIEPVVDGVIVHDYTEHQRTSDEIAALREKRRQAGSKGGKAKASATAQAKALATAVAKQTASKDVAESETEKEELLRSSQRASALRSTDDPRFVEFWSTYPRREGKTSALRALGNALGKATIEDIVKGAARYRDDPNREPAFTAHPATWLNAGRWDDDPLPAKTRTVNPDDTAGWAR